MPIEPSDLQAVHDRPSLFGFLREHLGWRVEHGDTFTYDGPRLHGDVAARVEVSQIVPLTGNDPFTIMLAEFQAPFRRGDLRAILRKVREEIRQEARYDGHKLDQIVFVCAAEGYSGVRFARFEERAGRQPKLSTFGWDQDDIQGTRTLRSDNLPALAMPLNLLGEADWERARWEAAWDVEKVTGEFYREYRRVFYDLEGAIQGVRGNPVLFTQRLCNRLLFAQFLAKKRWLNRDRDYLRNLFSLARDHAAKPGIRAERRANFYSDFLHPLFFKALNTPADARPADAEWSALSEPLGDVPFLNGGLFAPQDADDAPCAVTIPNDAFVPMLDLFARFNFTLMESTPDDVEVAVDAEMLGKVFEELVNEDKRHDTGSYYTPRGIVSFMCREAIKGYLGGDETVARFVDEGDPSEIRDPEAILDALKLVTVCDPACGSGAYLLGMMQELLRLREGLFTRKAKDYRRIYDRKLEIIQRNLYGVDKEPFAVNIAMLRLWLSLVVDNDAPVDDVVSGVVDVSLPNLKFKIQCGDALTAPMANFNLFGDEYARDAARLRALENEYFDPPHSDRPARAKGVIEAEIQAQQERIANLIGSHADPNAVDWSVRFAEVFAAPEPLQTLGGSLNMGQGDLAEHPEPGGFSIVLANPPYVRQELIRDLKPVLKQVFPDVYNGTADLYTYFYARGIELLRPGGMLAFISPNQWFRAAYGAKLREYVARTCRVLGVTDFGELPVFQTAATFPAVFVAQKGVADRPRPVYTQVRSLEPPYPDVLAVVRTDGRRLSAGAVAGSGWALNDETTAARMQTIQASGIRLRNFVGAPVYTGIKTGLNQAYVIDGALRQQLIALEPQSAEIIKPLARGRDITRWVIRGGMGPDRWLIAAKIGVDISRYSAIFAHLQQWQDELEHRTDKGNHWWELRSCDYYCELEKPKIVATKAALRPAFALDTEGLFLANTTYFIPLPGTDDPRYVLGVLNSEAVLGYLRSATITIGNPDRRGRVEPRQEDLMNIPVPDASPDERLAISALVQKCLDAKGVGCEAWEAEISERVAALYGL